MAITLSRSYAGVPAGNTVQFPAELEAALIAQGMGSSAARTAITTGAQTQNTMSGTAAIAAGASSVVVTNANVDANSQIRANVAQATADGTLLRVERVVAAAGSFTIYGTANATATTLIDWVVVPSIGFQRL
jgi:activator of HSP90 ATPase